MRFVIGNSRGQSLVQVLVAVGILGIIIMGIISSTNLQNREMTSFTERLSSLDLGRQISDSLTDAVTCSALFAASNVVSPASLTFDSSAVSTSHPFVITLKNVPGIGTSPPLVTQNSFPSPLSHSLFVPTGGIQLRVTSADSANLVVSLDQTKLVRPIHDITTRINLSTSGPVASKSIVGCRGGTQSITTYKVSDFGAMAPAVNKNDPDYHAVTYTITIPTQTYDQHLFISAYGIWDVTACGTFPSPCQTLVSINATVNGVYVPCGSNTTTGSSGPYTNVIASQVSCIVNVPANTTATLAYFLDARNGAWANYNAGTYNTSYATATTDVMNIYSLR